jgi:hypothetical protein
MPDTMIGGEMSHKRTDTTVRFAYAGPDPAKGSLVGMKEVFGMDHATKKLFEEYEKAFNALEVEKQAPLFAEHFISAGPKGSIAQGRDELMQMSRQAAEYYRSVGQTGAKILSMKETPISDEYTMITVHWGATFRKTGDKPIEFDVSYFVQNTDGNPKIIMFIAHQDEEKAMQELGLLED